MCEDKKVGHVDIASVKKSRVNVGTVAPCGEYATGLKPVGCKDGKVGQVHYTAFVQVHTPPHLAVPVHTIDMGSAKSLLGPG